MDDKSTKTLLRNDYDNWNSEIIRNASLSSNEFDHKSAKKFVQKIVSGTSFAKSKPKEKEAKRNLEKSDTDYVWKKEALKVIKLQRHRETDDVTTENEYSFTIDYFSKILKYIFYLKKNVWKFKWGEVKLNASKEEENLAKNDDQNRSVGSSIDAILTSKSISLDYLLLEISGPMLKEDYVHFLRDRLKLAKNLKYLFKSILRQKLVLSDIKKLKLYGMQVYKNTIYLYSLSMPIMNIFCFAKIMKFDIPLEPALFSKDLPTYVKNLVKMLGYVSFGYHELELYLTTHESYESDESHSSNDTLSPPYLSPTKAGSKRKERS